MRLNTGMVGNDLITDTVAIDERYAAVCLKGNHRDYVTHISLLCDPSLPVGSSPIHRIVTAVVEVRGG